ncbi:hypothetical protein HYFRA_00012338 [Hymenoscyphus fraxineus]|uniref:Cleavage/polyadenylation specificity factor A subunit C-terminal domain-containing protein n=1 Tax=Hymenoscyphus fraxineus TaxID=746836 RepID=A0A9N9L260_9HELO|nr:hypothetical protein HYFRA_00012338 [Hymenoscyphus fraxineus]
MQCYTELTPPTAVSHSLRLPFLSAESNNLIVAKTSLLQIFSLKTISIESDEPTEEEKSAKQSKGYDRRATDDESSLLGPDAISRPPPRSTRTKLVLIAEYTLSGTVTSLARIKTLSSKSGGEALLVGFKDAKLSLVEWDPERPGISTISIHYYEQDDLHGSPWTTDVGDCINYLTADPGNRCAALKFGARNLAILPFKQGDEDVNMADWDEELDGPRPESQAVAKAANGDGDKADTPYGASFVLRLPTLNLNLIYPIHLAFLHEYREPTFGILSSNQLPASSLLHERKDHLSYMVFTLDLHQKASTPILSVGGLPFDLFKIVPLPAPVGGALLVGGNELIHIDQAGKANGVAVNPFAKQSTSFALVNQADLDMRLESCEIELLSIQNGEMLIILQSGELAILSFRMDGRSVSGLSIRRVAKESGGLVLSSGASTISQLGTNALFVGSEGTDSVVLGWTRKSNQISRRKSRLDFIEGIDEALLDEEDEEDDDPDDELYGGAPATTQAAANPAEATSSKAGDYVFQIHDSLVNIAPIIDVVLGSSAPYQTDEEKRTSEDVRSDLQLVAATGKNRGGSLAIIHRSIQPKVIGKFEFAEARGLWTMSAKRPAMKGLQASKEKNVLSGDYGNEAQFDRLMIVSKKIDETEKSDVYVLTDAGFEELTTPEYSSDVGATIEAGTLGNGMRIIQVVKTQVRAYDGDLGLAQILEMEDEDTGIEPNIVSASLADPFVLLIRDDASIYVANCDESYDLEEVEREDEALLTTKWLTGCLYKDTTGVFASGQSDAAQEYGKNVMMFLLSAGGALHIYALPDLSKPVYVAEGLCFVPPVLSADYAARRSAARETLTEIIVADLGDSISKSPYLIVRPSADDLTIYEPFRVNSESSPKSLSSSLQFLKIHNPHLAKSPEVSAVEIAEDGDEMRNEPMRAMENVGGYSTVFLPGASPSFIMKSAKSTPKVIGLQGVGVRGMSSFHTSGCDRGFIYTDVNGVARVAQLPEDTDFAQLGVSLQKVPLDEDLHALAYHPPMECYVAATCTRVDFELPKDDDYRRDWQREDISFKPTMEQGYLRLINPINWTVIDTVTMDPFEVIMCVKTLNLEVSESTNERKQLITVGTAIARGEDLPIKGRIYVFDVVSVVPEPNRPETNKKLKLIAREEIPRGAITGVSEIGTQGFMLVAQGQKCMVRGLKEDGTLLPVAFMDMNCYVTAVKELRGTGLCVLSDAVKGVWFVGYTEEPYKMMLFGKSATKMEILTADLLPDGKELYIVAADADCNLHVMQFDPERKS